MRGHCITSNEEIIKAYRDNKMFIRQIAKELKVGILRIRSVLDENGLR